MWSCQRAAQFSRLLRTSEYQDIMAVGVSVCDGQTDGHKAIELVGIGYRASIASLVEIEGLWKE